MTVSLHIPMPSLCDYANKGDKSLKRRRMRASLWGESTSSSLRGFGTLNQIGLRATAQNKVQ